MGSRGLAGRAGPSYASERRSARTDSQKVDRVPRVPRHRRRVNEQLTHQPICPCCYKSLEVGLSRKMKGLEVVQFQHDPFP